jgi:hypothetical protein
VADEDGRFDWAAPDEEVHAAVNDVVRPVGTYLLGRRMYEVLVPWETMDTAEAGVEREDAGGTGIRPRGRTADEGRRGP